MDIQLILKMGMSFLDDIFVIKLNCLHNKFRVKYKTKKQLSNNKCYYQTYCLINRHNFMTLKQKNTR